MSVQPTWKGGRGLRSLIGSMIWALSLVLVQSVLLGAEPDVVSTNGVAATRTNTVAGSSEEDRSSSRRESRSERRSERRRDEGTNSSAASTVPQGTDFPSFRLISERNIFNGDRSKRVSRESGERPKVARIDTLTLVGILGSASGNLAFFDGSSSAYRVAAKPGEKAGTFKVSSVTSNRAVLESDDTKFELEVGAGLRREEDGPWSKSSSGLASAAPAPSSEGAGNTESPADAGGDDVLARLLKKREQEINK